MSEPLEAQKHRFSQRDWVEALRSGKEIYRLAELARLAGHSEAAARRAVQRLRRRGWLARLGKGLYANVLRAEGPPSVERVAAALYPPAYVSLSSALFTHGVVDQAPQLLTCVTTNKKKRFQTDLGEIRYRQIKPALFFGYALRDGVPLAQAEKAALDFVYLELQDGRRPNLDEWNWEELNAAQLWRWAEAYPRTVRDRLQRFAP